MEPDWSTREIKDMAWCCRWRPADTINKYGWWVFEKDGIHMYSTLFFAVVPDGKATGIMESITSVREEWDPNHSPRAFMVDVEKMV